jgi:hypothetical protein
MKPTRQTEIIHLIAALLAAVITVALAGCGKDGSSSGKPSAPTKAPQTAAPSTTLPAKAPQTTELSTTPPMEQVLAAWQQGQKAGAVQQFLETDWKSGPLFSPGSPLRHRQSELPGMSQAAREKLMGEVEAQLGDLKQLAAAVRDKGQAVASTDPALARRCLAKLDEVGAALDQPGDIKIVQLVGQSIRQMAAPEPRNSPARKR